MSSLKFLVLTFLSVNIAFAQNAELGELYFRNVGPASSGGRVVDIEAQADDFTQVYVASASGGVWKSVNAGTTWDPIFDDYETASIGDIALDPSNSDVIWVGTGEANNRNSVSWGNGMYKSTDGGQSFENKGLQSTHQISRVLVNPDDTEEVCACAIGHLWGYSGDRGLFITKNGGATWEKKTKGLPNDGKTGCIDLVRDSKNSKVLYAAFYHRLRQPWTFTSGGDEGGIYKSMDGGESWTQLTNGLPKGPTGRIGLAIYDKDPNILMAIVEAEKTDDLSRPGTGIYRSENGGENWTYVNTYNNRPFYYSQIRINPQDDQKVYVLTTRFMVSEDGGTTFVNGSDDQEVHGDFHAMWLDPLHKDRYYLGADKGFSLTHDHGAHFQLIDNLPISQFYRIGYDMQEPYYIYGGLQDNGSFAVASFSRDARGILNDDNWKMHWGDGQDAVINPLDHREGYSSMEKGSYFSYNPVTREMQRISPSFSNTLNYSDYIENNQEDLSSAIRFNWSAPMVMSSHDPSVLYVGGNYLFKTDNKGKTWKIISPDLSTNDPVKRKLGVSGGLTPDNSGAENHCSIHSISVSTISEQVIWVGTDDGLVHVTMDGGANWSNVRANIPSVPSGLWVSRVEASHFDVGRAYVTFDGHRSDDFGTWIFATDDYGRSWRKITNGITTGETVRVIREDHINPDLLFIGTETGVWCSVNRGNQWNRMAGLPTVSVYDLKIHTRDNDLIVATHGRGIWIMDDISPLQELSSAVSLKPLHLFTQKEATLWENVSRGGQRGHFWWAGDNPKYIENTSSLARAEYTATVPISFYVGDNSLDSLSIVIKDPIELTTHTKTIKVHRGINRYYWNREFDAQEYTAEEAQKVEAIFQDILANNAALGVMYKRFNTAKNPYDKRKVVESLKGGFLSYPIPDRFGIVKAEEGYYEIHLSTDNKSEVGSVELRRDPILER